jgi:Tfp pilus assembly protein PilF
VANPADVEIVNNLGYAYLLNNDLVPAEDYMLIALTMQPDRSAAWDNLGHIYAKKGKTADAVASFSNAYRFSGDVNRTHSYFVNLMEKENDVNLKQALRQATQVGERKFLSAEANVGIPSEN